jgi:hypothetical protein
MLVLFVIYSFVDLWWGIITGAEKIKLLESEDVRENDFYWQFQLTLRNNWNNEALAVIRPECEARTEWE